MRPTRGIVIYKIGVILDYLKEYSSYTYDMKVYEDLIKIGLINLINGNALFGSLAIYVSGEPIDSVMKFYKNTNELNSIENVMLDNMDYCNCVLEDLSTIFNKCNGCVNITDLGVVDEKVMIVFSYMGRG